MSLWKLVLAVWLVPVAIFTPPAVVAAAVLGPALARLPGPATEAVAGDLNLIAAAALRPVVPALLWLVIAGLLLVWLWTVLWHAGVACWRLWSSGGPPRLSEILGLGLGWWWRYLRLALIGITVMVVLCGALWAVLWHGIVGALWGMAEARATWLLFLGIAASSAIALTVWMATLRGAWLLAAPDARSALAGWGGGLAGTFRQLPISLATLLLWAIPAALLSVLPVAAGAGPAVLEGGMATLAMLFVGGLLRAYCRVALFCSFAPVSGLAGGAADSEDGQTQAAG